MIRDNTCVEFMFEADVFNHNWEDVALTENFFGMGVIKGISREFLTDVKVLAFDHGHHHTHHIVPAKHAMRKDHVNGGFNTISHFG